MSWSHPDISLEDLLHLIEGFVDILILASGYQSSGHAASWDADNVKKAVRWGLFFEEVFRRLHESDDYQDSVKELDAALLKLTSDSSFPPGLINLSSKTLSRARDLVLEYFFQNLHLREKHIRALLTAIIELDVEDLTKADAGGINLYADMLMQQMKSLHLVPQKRCFMQDPVTSPLTADLRNSDGLEGVKRVAPDIKTDEQRGVNHSSFIIPELLRRQASVSCLSSVETSLDTVLELVTRNSFVGSETGNDIFPAIEEKMGEFLLWNHWRSRNLSFLLDKRTIRLLSGAKLIFSAPKLQWDRTFESLKVSTDAHNDNLLEITELSLLGLISSRWTCLVEHFTSFSCDFLPISKQYFWVQNLLQERSVFLHLKGKVMNSKENDIFEYVMALLGTQPHKLWKLPPVLVAAALPSCSSLFRSYLNGIERELNGHSASIRCCTCRQDGKEHRDCEVAERIWCLYMFHIQGSHLMVHNCGTQR